MSRTIAETIAAALNDDGQNWRTSDGQTMDDLIDLHDGVLTWRDGWRTGDTVRANFSDGSCITMAGEAWDVGFPTCFCWAGIGHNDDCSHTSHT